LLLLPTLIRSAYAGDSFFAPLNSVIQGQAQHPVTYYLGLWRRAALVLTGAGLALAVVGTLAWAWIATAVTTLRHGLRVAPVVGVGGTVAIGVCLGFVGGLAETLTLAVRFLMHPDPREAPPVDALWMAPLATALLGALAGLVLALAVRAWRGLSIAVPIALMAGFAAFAVLKALKLGLHPTAGMILSAGIAVELARRARAHGPAVAGFARRAVPWLAVLTLAGAVGVRGVLWVRERAARPAAGSALAGAPNVLLLILDTVRAASLGLYGYPRATTPEIERLAAMGVTFDRAIVGAPWTLPSHASMFTGLPPHQLSADFDRALDGAAPTLAEVLQRRGYATGGFVANPTYASRASGLNRGFATYRDHAVSLPELVDNAFWPRQVVGRWRRAMGEHGRLVRKIAADVNREALDWVPTDGRPFFAFLNYFDAHEPYETTPPFDRVFSADPPKFWLATGWRSRQDPGELEEVRNAYDSNIAYIDHQIGALLRDLEARGLMDNTIVIITSDHGEHLGEHGGLMAHANSLYLPLLQVPLVIVYPPGVPAGRRITEPAALQNLAATVLDLVNVPAEDMLPGTSLAEMWSAPGDTTFVRRGLPAILSLLSDNTFSHPDDPIQLGPMQSIVRGNLHYIRNGDGSEELFDVDSDPLEGNNLAGGVEGELRLPELRKALDALLGTEFQPRAPGVDPRREARLRARQPEDSSRQLTARRTAPRP
jgi:arylsulfatase A-like enzyme